MKHIVVGDIHLGASLRIGKPASIGQLNSRISDKMVLLDWILDYADTNDIGHIIITGDVYEEQRPHPAVIDCFMRWLKRCEAANIFVDIIAGNHDIIRTGSYMVSALDLISAVEMPKTLVFKEPHLRVFNETAFTYVPYRDRRMYEVETPEEALDQIFGEIDKIKDLSVCNNNILIGHLSLKGSLKIIDEISDSLNEVFVPIDRLTDWDMTIMGHIHHPQVIQEKPHVCHIGSMDRSDFHINETDVDKIIMILDDDGSWEKKVLPTRNLRAIDVTVPGSVDDSTEYVIRSIELHNKSLPIKDSIVRLNIVLAEDVGDISRADVEKYLYDIMDVHHICNFSESRAISSVLLDEENDFDSTDSVPSSIDKFMEYKTDFEDDEQRDRVRAIAHECYDLYEEKQSAKEL